MGNLTLNALRGDNSPAFRNSITLAASTQLVSGTVYRVDSVQRNCKQVIIGSDTVSMIVLLWNDSVQARDNWNISLGDKVIWDVYPYRGCYKLYDYYRLNDKLFNKAEEAARRYTDLNLELEIIDHKLAGIVRSIQERHGLIAYEKEVHRSRNNALEALDAVAIGGKLIASFFTCGLSLLSIPSDVNRIITRNEYGSQAHKDALGKLLDSQKELKLSAMAMIQEQKRKINGLQILLESTKAQPWKTSNGSDNATAALVLPYQTVTSSILSL